MEPVVPYLKKVCIKAACFFFELPGISYFKFPGYAAACRLVPAVNENFDIKIFAKMGKFTAFADLLGTIECEY